MYNRYEYVSNVTNELFENSQHAPEVWLGLYLEERLGLHLGELFSSKVLTDKEEISQVVTYLIFVTRTEGMDRAQVLMEKMDGLLDAIEAGMSHIEEFMKGYEPNKGSYVSDII